jgi:DNA-binding CsgD family transcriptional regulator
VHAIVGREAELEAVERFLDGVPSGPLALLIEGEAGIGKTTLWLEAVRAAADRAYRVLQVRPAQSEAELSYVALTDLLGEAFDVTRASLPAPQERALAIALLRGQPNEPADPRTTATGLVGVLTALTADAPLVLAIDDVQWLDAASARALEFAARRLPPRVGLLVTRRAQGIDQAPLGLRRALPEDRLQHVVPGPLSLAALHQVIELGLGTALSRPTLARIQDASGGNPFFALEIARALARDPSDYRLGDPLPVPQSLQELVLDHLRALSADAHAAVLVAAALSRPTVAMVAEALAPERNAESALVAAEEAGVLVVEQERIRFTHPLLASVVYAAASNSQRRRLHRRLAEVVADPEERARHLASSVTDADEGTASELEQAARRAALRGAHDAAAELFEASCQLTAPNHIEELVERTLGRASAVIESGDLASARALAQQAVADAPTRALRVRALLLLCFVDWQAGAVESVLEHLEESLAAAGDDRDLQRDVNASLVGYMVPLDPKRTLELVEPAEQLLTGEHRPGQVSSLFGRFWAEAQLGLKPNRELLERGLELEAKASPLSAAPINWYTSTDEFDAARARHAIEDEWFRDRGREHLRADRLAYLALIELRAGRWDLADEHAERSCNMVDEFEIGLPHAVAFGYRSLIDAHRGRVERARSTLASLMDDTEHQVWRHFVDRLLSILGFVEFAAGDHEAADRALTQMRQLHASIGVTEPMFDRSEPFHIESLLALGELDRAQETLLRLEERGRRFPRLWIDVTLPRGRALVLAAQGDVAAALAAIEELDLEAASQLPFELGWALLVKGRLLRRSKRRRSAAATLGEALEIFERLGAPAWAEQARSELARVEPRRRAPDDLTATELRVAELAAAGLTNREVAKAAFISPKTVEANLARVYRKLGIRSRAELGARMHGRGDAAGTKT